MKRYKPQEHSRRPVLNEERRRAILDLLRRQGRVLVPELSRHFGIPLLATNDVYYHDPCRRALQALPLREQYRLPYPKTPMQETMGSSFCSTPITCRAGPCTT